MFLDVASTHTKCIMNDFALAPRTDLLNFECHTVTNGTDLRKSPQQYLTEGNKSEYQWLVLSLLYGNLDLFLTDKTAARLGL